jgi:membrane protein
VGGPAPRGRRPPAPAAARRRSRFVAHVWRAKERYFDVHGGQLAAAISYYAFFAAFSLSLLALAVSGYLLDYPTIYHTVEEWLESNLPIIDIGVLEDSRRSVGILAGVALVVAGVAWVQAVRAAIRQVWGLEAQPGNPILRWAIDLLVLIGMGVLLLITLGAAAGAEWVLAWLNLDRTEGRLAIVISAGSIGVGLLANALMAAVLLQALPRLALPPRRVIGPAMTVSVGLEALKTVGRVYITHVSDRPAYQAVTTAVGLLLFLYLFNILMLMAASWTATSMRGNAIDLYERAVIRPDRDSA